MPPKQSKEIIIEFDKTSIKAVEEEIKRLESLDETKSSAFEDASTEADDCVTTIFNEAEPDKTEIHEGATQRVNDAAEDVKASGKDYQVLLTTLQETFDILLELKLQRDGDTTDEDVATRKAYVNRSDNHKDKYNRVYNEILAVIGHQQKLLKKASGSETENRSRGVKVAVEYKPNVLRIDDPPSEMCAWKRTFENYITESGIQQDEYRRINPLLETYLDKPVRTAIKFEPAGKVRLTSKTKDEPTIFGNIEAAWIRKYPLVRRRADCFNVMQQPNEPYYTYRARVFSLAAFADLKDISEEELIAYIIYKGLTGPNGQAVKKQLVRSESTKDGKIIAEDIDRLADDEEIIENLEEKSERSYPSHTVHKIVQGGSRKPREVIDNGWQKMLGPQKLDAMLAAGLCKYCAKPHTGTCRFKSAQCKNCGGKGHLIVACSKPKQTQQTQASQPTPANSNAAPRT